MLSSPKYHVKADLEKSIISRVFSNIQSNAHVNKKGNLGSDASNFFLTDDILGQFDLNGSCWIYILNSIQNLKKCTAENTFRN